MSIGAIITSIASALAILFGILFTKNKQVQKERERTQIVQAQLQQKNEELKKERAEKQAMQKTAAAAEKLKKKKAQQKKKQKELEKQIANTGEELSEDAKNAAAAISSDLTDSLR